MAFIRARRRARTGTTVFEVRWREGGQQRRQVVGSDRRMAEARLAEVARRELEARRASEVAGDGADLVERFLAALRMAGRREGTIDYYERRLQLWLAEHPGVPVHRWSRAMFEAHLARHADWSPRTRRIALAALRRLARWARRAGVFVPEVTEGVELPTGRTAPRRPLQPVEVDAVLAAADGHHYAPAVALAAYAGLSLGDLRTLTWGEVDLDAGWIVRAEGRQKTGRPLRVPILPQLATVLSSHRPLRPQPSALVCARLPARAQNTGETLRRLYLRAGLPDASGWHLLRHSFGTLLMRAGVPTAVIGRLLSHAPGSAITALYQHPDDGDLVTAMRSLGAHLALARQQG